MFLSLRGTHSGNFSTVRRFSNKHFPAKITTIVKTIVNRIFSFWKFSVVTIRKISQCYCAFCLFECYSRNKVIKNYSVNTRKESVEERIDRTIRIAAQKHRNKQTGNKSMGAKHASSIQIFIVFKDGIPNQF